MTNSAGNTAATKSFIMVTVPTKTYDGGAKAAFTSEPTSTRHRKTPVRKHENPFMYYSHLETRMHALFFHDENENDSLPNEPAINREPVVRKTRISFELYPTLLLEDFLLEDHHLRA